MDESKKIIFETKEDSNERRLQEFLAKSPHERFISFLQLCGEMEFLYKGKGHPNQVKNNFIIEKELDSLS